MVKTIDRSDLVTQLADLRARRPSLALRAARGDDDARRELAAVDADARAYESDIQLLALAGAEERRLAVAQAERDAADQRRDLERAYAEAEQARAAAFRRVEATLTELGGHALAAEAAAREMDRLAAPLGRAPIAAWQSQARSGIKGRVATYFWSVVGWVGPMPSGHWEPLVDDDGGAR